MNPEQLLQHFDRISEAPDAIPRLRRFILDLAVRGKLVEQNSNDEPAVELLKRIEAEKARLIKDGRIRKTKALEALSHEDFEFKIPRNWIGSRLGNAYDVRDGTHDTPKYVDSGYPLVTSKNLSSGRLSFDDIKFISEQDHRQISERSLVEKNDILLAMIGSIGNPVIVDTDRKFSIKNVALFKYYDRTTANPGFLCLYLRHAANKMQELAAGGLQPFVSLGFLRNYPIAVPPLAEQHRMVAKVDELMVLCDQLQVAQTEREQSRDRLVAASLHNLNPPADDEAANTPDAQREHYRFLFNHLPRLTTRPAHIKQLRQTILNLAVRGKLVAQDPNDEPAEVLLKMLLAEKSRMEKGGAIRKQQLLSALRSEEIPFELPALWEWQRLGNIGLTQTGTTPSSNNPEYFGDFIPFVKPANLTGNCIDYSGEGISEEGIQYSRLIPKHSALMVCIGSSIGKVNVTEKDVCCNQQINAVTPYIDELTGFTTIALKTTYFQKLVLANAGMGTLPIISKGKWEVLPVPVPPLTEQHRIVAKVDELMALCDQLETQLTSTATDSRRLLEAVLLEALLPATEQAA
jgi:type I restriction enzyme S subunit